MKWYRRPRTLVVAAVAAVVAVAVVTDLPNGNSNPAATATSYIQSVKSYDASCIGAINEAFTLESLVLTGQASSSERSEVPGLLRDDLNACSYTNSDLYDMQSNLQPPGGAAGQQLGLVNSCVVQWEFPDANQAILALTNLLGPPTGPAAVPMLRYWENQMTESSKLATEHLDLAAADVHASLPALALPTPANVKLPKTPANTYRPPSQDKSPCLKP